MNTRPLRLSAAIAVSGIAAVTLAACVVAGAGPGYGGYGGDVGMGAGVGYYEPIGGVYGLWAPGYQVGPYRDGGRGWVGGNGPHAYHTSHGVRSPPSIPSRSRSRR